MTVLLLIPYVAALVLFVAELRGALSPLRMPLRFASPLWLVAILVVTYCLQLAVLRTVAMTTFRYADMVAHGYVMPLPVIYAVFPHPDLLYAAFVLLGGLQTAALVSLYRTSIPKPILWFGCATLLLLSIASPVLSSFDIYGYVQNAILGGAAFAPPHVHFLGEYRVFDYWWEQPTTTLYGPLWIPIVQIVTAGATTLLGKMICWRIFCAALFVSFALLIRAYGHSQRMTAMAALNPALAFLTVANGHNDLLAIVIVVAAAIVIRSWPIAGILMTAAAGLIKLPYVLLALPIFSRLRSPAAKYAACCAAIVTTVLLSVLGGGPAYFAALRAHAGVITISTAIQGIAAAVSAGLIVLAVAGGRRFRTAGWLFPTFGSLRMQWSFPWYTLFAIPYALGSRRVLRYLLVSLPFVTALITPELMRSWSFLFAIPVATVLSINLSRGRSFRTDSTTPSAPRL